jgi:tetratricopeptide (TPR) repeat protein
MALRTAKATTTERAQARSQAEWRAQVERVLGEGAAAVRSGDPAALAAAFGQLDAWDDRNRAYQARSNLAELVLGADGATRASWTAFYATAADALVTALEQEPREPVLQNALGVLLYELLELRGARACFEAAARLDAELPHVRRNLEELRRRERQRPSAGLPKGLAARVRVLGSRAVKTAERAQPASGLKLSLCMIVKDEEEMLPGCLEAIASAVDEIIVVDTGSSDETVAIAERFGAKVVHFPWNGSFADARNVSLDHATGDWLLYLDADEHLEEGDAPLVRELLGRTWREGFYLVETNYTGGDESGHAVTHTALRLFRNRPEYRFEGRIHEQKTQTMPTFLPERFETTRIRLRHYGYLKGRIAGKDKSRRNIELLERERREAPGPFNAFNLGSEHMALGDWEASRSYLDQAWNEVRELDGWQGIPYVPLLASRLVRARREAGDTAAAAAATAEGLAAFPDHTDLVFEQAVCLREDGDLAGAVALAERCLEMGDAPSHYAATVGSGSHLALTFLAELRALQRRVDEAEALYRRALDQHPDFVAPVLHLASLMLRRGASDDEVSRTVPAERPSARLLLATAFHECERHEAAEREFRAVLARQPANGVARIGLVESLLSQRRYEDAVAEAALEPADSPFRPHAVLSALFAEAARSDVEQLGVQLELAQEAGLPAPVVDVYRAWRALLAGEEGPRSLPAEAAGPVVTALGALLRVQELEAFETVHRLLERTAIHTRERRELLAQLYLRRGFLESAADEWIAVCDEAPDAQALVGLSQVAFARGFLGDAEALAEGALELDPGSVEAARLLAAARRGANGAAAPVQ